MAKLTEIAEWVGATVSGREEAEIARVASLAQADGTSLVFAESAANVQAALASAAGAVLVSLAAELPAEVQKPVLRVKQPKLAFAIAARRLRAVDTTAGIDPTAVVAASAQVAESVFVDAFAVIGEHVELGAGVRIGAGCVVGAGVKIGAATKLYPRVTIYPGTTLGERVVVHAGAVLGADGFGYARDAASGEYIQFPQQGTLAIEDDVEIGANTTIDRGALEETRICHGAKIDNLVHIGHNCRIGRNVVIAAQTGISGSSVVEDGAILGGQVGMGEHATVGPNVILGGGAGVLSGKKLRGPGEVFWGRPAQPLKEYLRGLAVLAKLAKRS
ncbi:MAG: UDP-3-O-(3-hydroxymyristoyl)glucosamine N-acyltransferase [Acidobacteriaceae bacterium]